MNGTEIAILSVLSEHAEVEGTEQLALLVGVSNKHHVFTSALLLMRQNLIDVIFSDGGRGRKTTYRRKESLFLAEKKP